jgi:hypothetical protein
MLAGACQAVGPLAPDSLPAEFVVPTALGPALALLDSDPRPVPLLGLPAGAWVRNRVRGIVIDHDLPAAVRARCCEEDRMIHWSTGWLPDPQNVDDVRFAAAIIMHEARHAEGYRHTCPDARRDRTVEEGGAWAVHAAWLQHAGDTATAGMILAADIGCR